jgi:hypothetical protein
MGDILTEIRDIARAGVPVNVNLAVQDDLYWKAGLTIVLTVLLASLAYYFVKSKF